MRPTGLGNTERRPGGIRTCFIIGHNADPARSRCRGSIVSSISIKGIVVGNLFAMATELMVGLAVMVTLAAPYETDGFNRAYETMNAGLGFVAGLTLTSLIGVTAGFLAARVAGKGELLNGTLTSILYVTYRIACWPEDPGVHTFVDIACAPLLGLFGGYLRLRQARRAQR